MHIVSNLVSVKNIHGINFHEPDVMIVATVKDLVLLFIIYVNPSRCGYRLCQKNLDRKQSFLNTLKEVQQNHSTI